MTIKELQKLIDLLVKFQHEVEPIDKEGGRTLGCAKDYCRIIMSNELMGVD
jgi:hypothetical protein